MENTTTFRTTNRTIEQFLYLHGIQHVSQGKDEYGMTYWDYPNNEEVQHVVGEYREGVRRNEETRRAKKCVQ